MNVFGLERDLERLNAACARNSGLPAYPQLDAKRRRVLAQFARRRRLTMWERLVAGEKLEGEFARVYRERGPHYVEAV